MVYTLWVYFRGGGGAVGWVHIVSTYPCKLAFPTIYRPRLVDGYVPRLSSTLGINQSAASFRPVWSLFERNWPDAVGALSLHSVLSYMLGIHIVTNNYYCYTLHICILF